MIQTSRVIAVALSAWWLFSLPWLRQYRVSPALQEVLARDQFD